MGMRRFALATFSIGLLGMLGYLASGSGTFELIAVVGFGSLLLGAYLRWLIGGSSRSSRRGRPAARR
jgi:hypothetical protein